ncbi:MAG TPA: Uma2 family endonuclease [Rhodothermales bacterium]|nr:Uma2 family endonuclease [Rhodothermales bacterium]
MQPKPRSYTVEEYLALDEAAPQGVRLEYWDGYLYLRGQPFDLEWGWQAALAMAGATARHNDITGNLYFSLRSRLGNRCHLYTSDMAVGLAGGRYVYPDLTIACGKRTFLDEGERILTNPTILVEVLSPSSRARDKDEKLSAYVQIDSLQDYWIVEQDSPTITRYIRQGNQWVLRIEGGRDTLIGSDHLSVEIPLNEIYPA